jgi:dipeptidyl aminopeptidase/acylaminoacyl peptidase
MSAEGDLLAGIIADPKDPERRALASWDISKLDPDKPNLPMRVTPTDGRMTFQSANAIKAGKILIRANQPWTGSLAGCGEGRTTGSTKTWIDRYYLTDETIARLDDLTARRRAVGVSDEMRRCLELATTPGFQDLPLDPDNVIETRMDQTDLKVTFSKLNLRTGDSTFLYDDIGELRINLIDPRDAKVLTKTKTEPRGNLRYDFQHYILNPQTGNFDLEAPLTSDADDRHTMTIVAFDEKTGKYFVATDKFSDKVAIHLYDARTDKFDDEVVFAHPEFDASGVVLGRRASNWGQILGFTYLGADPQTYWVDANLRSIQEGLEKALPGQSIALQDWTENFEKVLFVSNSPRHPPSYYLLVNKTKLVAIGNQRPWIKPETLGERKLVYYEARDGLKIPGLLTMPPGWKKGDAPPPAIVHPHGGPWARDFLGWDGSGWTQFLATRGYAVLQPQYRGSEGWGHKLWTAGDAEWGQKMQDDKDDGAEWMVKEGYAAKGRIAIFGYSYGGFAAFAAAVRPNGPFKCAIAGAGVANLTRIGNNWGEDRIQRAYQGRTVKGMDPQKNTDKLAMPILIYHGERDVRVPLFHATDFYNSVKSSDKAKLVVLKDMGHQMDKWTPDNIRDSLKAIEDFLVNDCKL